MLPHTPEDASFKPAGQCFTSEMSFIIIHVWGYKNSSVAGAHPLVLSGRNSDFNPRDLYQKFDLGSNVLLICFLLCSRV